LFRKPEGIGTRPRNQEDLPATLGLFAKPSILVIDNSGGIRIEPPIRRKIEAIMYKTSRAVSRPFGIYGERQA